MNLNNPWMKLYIHSDDMKFEVVKVCKSEKFANEYGQDEDIGIIATDEDGNIYIAKNEGEKL
ncbi:MAG: hypothetical protein JRJ00_00800 [Deltaproteobacteria bacterium]|nr:hypothetical protein [Deltaproteobacteria bacterium]